MYDELDNFENNLNPESKAINNKLEPDIKPLELDEEAQQSLKEELKIWKDTVKEISLKDKELLTAEDYKDKRIIDLYKQIRTINRRIRIEQNKNHNLDREWSVIEKQFNLKKKQPDGKDKMFIDHNQTIDNEAEQYKNKYNKLSNELSLIRMEFQSMKSLYHKMIRAFNSGFSHALKHEQKFIKTGKNSENIINENNIEDAIEYLNNPDFGFKGTQEYIDDYNFKLKELGTKHLNITTKPLKEIDPNLEKYDKVEDDDLKAKLKKEITELATILEYKDNDLKLSTKRYHQSLAKKRTLDTELAESKQQVKFLLDNDTKCRNIIETQKQVILSLDRKRRGENYELAVRDERGEIEDNIRNMGEEIENLKIQIKNKHGKTDKTINDLIKENNDLKKKLNRAKAK